jgi:hypothetical protein
MDNRRLDTAAVMALGITALPKPDTDIPTDREVFSNSARDWNSPSTEQVVEALEAGKLVEASNYHGIPHAWKVADGEYRGILLQYRSITENERFATAEEAAEWFCDMHGRTDG